MPGDQLSVWVTVECRQHPQIKIIHRGGQSVRESQGIGHSPKEALPLLTSEKGPLRPKSMSRGKPQNLQWWKWGFLKATWPPVMVYIALRQTVVSLIPLLLSEAGKSVSWMPLPASFQVRVCQGEEFTWNLEGELGELEGKTITFGRSRWSDTVTERCHIPGRPPSAGPLSSRSEYSVFLWGLTLFTQSASSLPYLAAVSTEFLTTSPFWVPLNNQTCVAL